MNEAGITNSVAEKKEQQEVFQDVETQNIPFPGKDEDVMLCDRRCFAVLDGVTSYAIDRLGFDGETLSYGRFAAEVGKRALLETTHWRGTPQELAERIVSHVAGRLDQALTGMNFKEHPSFVFAAYFPETHLVVRVGDCSVLVDGVPVETMPNEELKVEAAKKRLRERLARLLSKKYPNAQEQEIQAQIRDITRIWQWKHRNRDESGSKHFGYGVIDGTHVPSRWVEWTLVPEGEHRVTLATDGIDRDKLAEGWSATQANLGAGWQPKDDVTYVSIKTQSA